MADEWELWISAAHIPRPENDRADKNSRMFERSSEWKHIWRVFKQIVSTFGKPERDLFASRINNQLSNYVCQRPDPGTMAIVAFSINWSTINKYCVATVEWFLWERTNYLFATRCDLIPEFFTEFYEKDCQHSSITLARSALVSAVTLRGYTILSDHLLVKCFTKGVYHLRPPEPKYTFIWDADILLRSQS